VADPARPIGVFDSGVGGLTFLGRSIDAHEIELIDL